MCVFVSVLNNGLYFLFRYVVDRLASQGITTIIPYRGADTEPRHLKLMGDLGRVNPVPFDPRVVNSVRDVIRPSHLVINLIGKDYETKHWAGSMIKNYTYDQVHAEIPRMIAQVCLLHGFHACFKLIDKILGSIFE